MAGRAMAAADLPLPMHCLTWPADGTAVLKRGLKPRRGATCAQCMPGCRRRPLLMMQNHAGARTFWNCCRRYSGCPERWASS